MPRGAKPKPTKLKIVAGNPGGRKLNMNEPQVSGTPECPKGLTAAARKEWARVVDYLAKNGIVGSVDSVGLAAYCQSYSRWLQAEKMIDKEGIVIDGPQGLKKHPAVTVANEASKLMRSFASEYGLTPASRSRINAKPEESVKDEAERYFG